VFAAFKARIVPVGKLIKHLLTFLAKLRKFVEFKAVNMIILCVWLVGNCTRAAYSLLYLDRGEQAITLGIFPSIPGSLLAAPANSSVSI
jgi:hypothetical protein